MWFALRNEDLGFIERAPVVHVCEARLAVPRPAVFGAFSDPWSWKEWFPGVRQASYDGASPYGVGTIRRAHVGGTHWEERMIAWEEPARLAYTVIRASVPFAHAQVECFEFTESGAGASVVRWTLALQPRMLARLGAPFAPRVVRRLFAQAAANLGAYLERAR